MDEVKLYEYFDQYEKPELSDDTLAHHGIIGQMWGHRNGPPYPLDSSKSTGSRLKGSAARKAKKAKKRRVKSLKKARKVREEKRAEQQQIQKSKDEIIKSKDINQMLKNVDNFSNQEISDMLKRLDIEGQLKDRVRKMNEANMPRSKKVVNELKKSVIEGIKEGTLQTTKQIGRNSIDLAKKKILEEFDNEDLNTLLGGGKKDKKKNKNKNKQENKEGGKK